MTWDLPLWQSLLPVGRDPATGGYRRYSFTEADSACREWFFNSAAERKLRAECDANGNLWAWLDVGSGAGAVVTGSHLDSVPDGGAFDGPLGVVSAFAALDLLSERGWRPVRPVGVVAFMEEEGARFGLACLGSKLLTGVIEPDVARGLTDSDGVSFAEAMAGAGLDPGGLGVDGGLADRVAAFVELHVEQGRALDGIGTGVGVGESIWPHGRWLIEFGGRADHAGTTRLTDRRDPMLPYAATILGARETAGEFGALATMSKVAAVPGGANGICSAVRAWLDARAADEDTLSALVARVLEVARGSADQHGVTVTSRCESFTPVVEFDRDLRDRVVAALAQRGVTAPVLATGAGHDAGVLARLVPTAMLFVRNRTGVSHSPAEHAEPEDCAAGVDALAAVLERLACR